jgi:hypothetical protein
MAIRSKNVDDNNSYNEFAQKIIPLAFNVVNASVALASASVGKLRLPWAGKIISGYINYSTSSGSVDIALGKNGTAISNVTTSGASNALSLTSSTFAAGDTLELIVTTAANEYAIGTATIVVRPYLGVAERVGASLGEF